MIRRACGGLHARLLLLVVLVVVPALGLTLYNATERRTREVGDVQRDALRLARLASQEQARLIGESRQLLMVLAQFSRVARGDSIRCSALFTELAQQFPKYTDLVAAEPNGTVFCSAKPLSAPVNLADREYFKRTLRTRDFTVSEYLIGRISGKPILTVSTPVLGPANRVQAVVAAGLDLTWLNRLVDLAGLPPNADIVVIDRRGTVLARYPDLERWAGKSAPEANIVKLVLAQQEGVAEAPGLDGIPRLFGFVRLREVGNAGEAFLWIGVPKSVAFAAANQTLFRNLLLLGIVTVLALAAAWLLANRFILRPVGRLLSTTRALSTGDLCARTGLPRGEGELAELARAFDEMADSLAARDAERQMAQEALRASRELLTTLLENAPAPIFVCAVDGRLRLVNRAWEEATRLRREGVVGRLVDEVFPAEVARQFLESNRPVIQTGIPVVVEECLTVGDGREYFQTIRFPLRDASGGVEAVGGIALDITERKRAEQALAESERKSRDLAELLPQAVFECDERGTLTFANRHAFEAFGYAREEFDRGLNAFTVIDPRDRDWAAENFQRTLRGEQINESEYTLLRKDGSRFRVALYSTPIIRQGRPVGMRGIVVDITRRKRAEERLAKLNECWLSFGVDPNENINRLVALCGEQLGATCALYTRLESEGLRAVGRWNAPPDILQQDGSEGLICHDVIHGDRKKDWVIRNLSQTEYGRRDPNLLRYGLQTYVGKAVALGDTPVGSVCVLYQEDYIPNQEDLRLLEMVAAAIGVEEARKRAEGALAERRRQLEAVRVVTAEITQELDLTVLLRLIVRRAVELVGADSGAIHLWDEGAQLLVPRAWFGMEDWVGTVRFGLGEGVAGVVAQRREGLCVNDYRISDYVHPVFLERSNITAVVGEPLRYRDQLLGVIVINIEGARQAFSESDRKTLGLFAAQAAIAIENARLYQEIQRYATDLESRVRERTHELEEARTEAEVASRHKSEFLANMSHELRTPLNSILGFAQLLMEQTEHLLSPKQLRFLTHVYTSGEHLLQLISDILDLSKVEAGKISLEPKALPVAETIENILVLARGLAAKKDQTIEADLAPDLPPLLADPVRFKQICFNLLSNAVKFTPDGGRVTVTARRASSALANSVEREPSSVERLGPVNGPRSTESPESLHPPRSTLHEFLEVAVTDTGIGIKAEDLSRLFQEFVQLEAAMTKRHEGTGLGLALTKRLVELHGGRIWAASEGEGRGSTFTVVLPFAGPAA